MIYQVSLAFVTVALGAIAVAGIVALTRRRSQRRLPSLEQLRQASADGKLHQRLRAQAEHLHREATDRMLKDL